MLNLIPFFGLILFILYILVKLHFVWFVCFVVV
jgi:hypothetical protein